MKSPTYLQRFGVVAIFVFAACAAQSNGAATAPRAARDLACGELERAGSMRPFSDGAPGIGMSELRAEDLPTFRGHDDELDPNAPVGVRYSVAAGPGSSEAWLERQIHCYRAARAGSAGDPLLVADARVRVSQASGRYLVDVTSRDRDTAREVLRAAAR